MVPTPRSVSRDVFLTTDSIGSDLGCLEALESNVRRKTLTSERRLIRLTF